MEIALSIHPEYINKILVGKKKYEFRRNLPRFNITKIYLYATTPICMVVGEVEVLGTISTDFEDLWQKTKMFAGISKRKLNQYFTDKETCHAFILGTVKKYDKPKMMSDFGIKKAPQSFTYIK